MDVTREELCTEEAKTIARWHSRIERMTDDLIKEGYRVSNVLGIMAKEQAKAEEEIKEYENDFALGGFCLNRKTAFGEGYK
ncbi:hypothetical protein OMAG_001081 [Candidatus Omnitrophus magneticus]|uniref:Uncharacterized protein n=1 Tax=Candidatus Omnitrophus magneticus TaxID=1609969 RepID=A0A0F0CNY2_9BACT|nr:hypothetical protein OMAG_001081 [Candidatus Omnitrophus magneticus]